jgi:hypothetical protein
MATKFHRRQQYKNCSSWRAAGLAASHVGANGPAVHPNGGKSGTIRRIVGLIGRIDGRQGEQTRRKTRLSNGGSSSTGGGSVRAGAGSLRISGAQTLGTVGIWYFFKTYVMWY